MKQHHRHHYTFGGLLGMTIAVIAIGIFGYASALPVEVTSTEPRDTIKFPDSVVIPTTDAEQLTASAEQRGIDVIDTTPSRNGISYMTVEGTTKDPDIQSLTTDASNIINGPVTKNRQYKATLVPNDTNYPAQWNLPKIHVPQAWDTTIGSNDVTVAVVDTGILFDQSWGGEISFSHPDFPANKQWPNQLEVGTTTFEGPAPNCTSRGLELDKKCNNIDDDSNGFIDDYQGWDFMGGWRGTSGYCPNELDATTYADPTYSNYINQDNDPSPYSCDNSMFPSQLNKDHYNGGCEYTSGACAISHGTSVGSIIGASSNDATGMAGVDWNTKLMNLRVLDGYGYGGSVQIAAAIDYATANGADVINLSLSLQDQNGCTNTDSLIDQAMQRAHNAGIVIVAASGNNGIEGVCYPARSPNAIAVGASTNTDDRAGFSTYGPELDVVAPGANVPGANAPSAYQAGNYTYSLYGTSFSAPHVAGATALLKSVYPSATPQDIYDRLTKSATRVSSMGSSSFNSFYGFGRLNIRAALDWTPQQAQTSTPAPKSAPVAPKPVLKTTLKRSESLYRNQSIRSSKGHRFVLLPDGNLVLYNAKKKAVWTSKTRGKGGHRLVLQKDGNLVLYTSKKKAVWDTRTYRKPGSRLVMQSDGNLVLYNTRNKPVWSTNTYRR